MTPDDRRKRLGVALRNPETATAAVRLQLVRLGLARPVEAPVQLTPAGRALMQRLNS